MWTTTVFLVLWNVLTHNYVHAGIMCYNCDHLPHQRDCDTIIECGDSEVCYGEEVLSEDGLITFRSGCKTKAQCGSVVSVLGKRADLIPCSKCCSSSYCNLELCDTPLTSNNKRCLSCPYALRPQDCHLSIQCNPEETCYTQTIVHNQEKRYRLGCIHKSQCAVGENILQVGVGKRQSPADYCGKCCENTVGNCNRELCTPGVNITSSALVQPPALMFCRDNSTSFCTSAIASDPSICSKDYYKFYQCPYTCGICGPIVTNSPSLTTPNADTTPTVTATHHIATTTTVTATTHADGCNDIGTHCDNALVCQIPDVAKLCKKSCNLCGATTATTAVVATPKPTVVTTHTPTVVTTHTPTVVPTHCPSHDPISDCQCKYLDQETDLCKESETNEELKKFCCYFCNKKKGITKCPDTDCDRLEKPEQDLVNSMHHNLSCTAQTG